MGSNNDGNDSEVICVGRQWHDMRHVFIRTVDLNVLAIHPVR